nr:arabinogalactan protein 1-like [Saimiri boliviensis boliviensis]
MGGTPGRGGRARRVSYLALGRRNGSSAELRGSPPRRRGKARNRAPPSSFPVATPPSPARTRDKAGAGGFTPGTSASAWPSLSLSSSPLQTPVTPPEPGLKTSPVSVRLSPQPPRSQDSASPRLAAARARDTCGHVTPAGTGRAA